MLSSGNSTVSNPHLGLDVPGPRRVRSCVWPWDWLWGMSQGKKTLDLERMEGMERNSGYKMQFLCNCCKILRKAKLLVFVRKDHPNFFKTLCMGNHEPKSVALTCLAFGQLQEIAATAATVVVGTCPDHDDPIVPASVMITCSAPHGLRLTVLGHAPSQAIYLFMRMFPA